MNDYKLTEKQKEVLKILANKNLNLLNNFNKRTLNSLHSKGYIEIVEDNKTLYIKITNLGKSILDKNMTMLESLLFYDNRNFIKK